MFQLYERQAVSWWLLRAKIWFRSKASPCGICGARSVTGTGLSSTTSVLPAEFHSTNYLYSHSLTHLSSNRYNRRCV